VAADESESWRRWLDRHGPALLLLARQLCHRTSDAEDAVQDGFVRFWRSRERANDPAAYLFACVRSAAMDSTRGRRRRARHEADAATFDARSSVFAASVEHQELRTNVESALARLPAEQREVVVMKIWGELTFAQIGEALTISPDTAASRYRYALAKLEPALASVAAR
jgi:RNA polymerase sigma-70 factor (ECF subfamily)